MFSQFIQKHKKTRNNKHKHTQKHKKKKQVLIMKLLSSSKI